MRKILRKILLVSAHRSERGLLEPIMKELKKRNDVKAKWCALEISPVKTMRGNIISLLTKIWCNIGLFKPNIILVPTDRWEMVYVAAYAFHHNIVVAHFHAGNVGSGIHDEMNRMAISHFSHIMLCNTVEDYYNLIKLGEEDWRLHIVGSTALNHVEIDESLCSPKPYDLVLLHPDPVSKEATRKDLEETLKTIQTSPRIVWLAPNKDKNYEAIMNFLDGIKFARIGSCGGLKSLYPNWPPKASVYIYLKNLPRPKFLGLLKNASRCIGNSSAFTLELPLLNPDAELIRIGLRNRNRNPPSMKTGASKRIAEILATIPLNEKLLRKKLVIT